jgi:ABC-type polysaccharide/polyol phosphate transport system ATPase subunit
MTSESIIELHQIAKMYTIWSSPAARLHGPLLGQVGQWPFLPDGARRFCERRSQESFREFYALRDISFTVQRGESVGIIGRNGCGKSTLLQIIAGTLTPTAGEVRLQGQVAALLELGSGFNPEFTGRENIQLNAAIRGLTTEQTAAKMDEIIAFADIGDFIDQPAKTYSSGMLVRVAFAAAVCVQPDVLIVDEALSVGDVFFQQKCFQRIHQLQAQGTTLLFVSHDTAAVQNLCQRVILLRQGVVDFEGAPEAAVGRYYSSSRGPTISIAAGTQSAQLPVTSAAGPLREKILTHDILYTARSRHGARDIEIAGACFLNEHSQAAFPVKMGAEARIHVLLRAHRTVVDPTMGIAIYDRMNNLVFAAGTQQQRYRMEPMHPGDERILTLAIRFAVQPGEYTFSLQCSEPSPDGPNVGYHQDWHEGLGPVSVHYPTDVTWPFYGVSLPLEITVQKP